MDQSLADAAHRSSGAGSGGNNGHFSGVGSSGGGGTPFNSGNRGRSGSARRRASPSYGSDGGSGGGGGSYGKGGSRRGSLSLLPSPHRRPSLDFGDFNADTDGNGGGGDQTMQLLGRSGSGGRSGSFDIDEEPALLGTQGRSKSLNDKNDTRDIDSRFDEESRFDRRPSMNRRGSTSIGNGNGSRHGSVVGSRRNSIVGDRDRRDSVSGGGDKSRRPSLPDDAAPDLTAANAFYRITHLMTGESRLFPFRCCFSSTPTIEHE
jgi:hypothetical protein